MAPKSILARSCRKCKMMVNHLYNFTSSSAGFVTETFYSPKNIVIMHKESSLLALAHVGQVLKVISVDSPTISRLERFSALLVTTMASTIVWAP